MLAIEAIANSNQPQGVNNDFVVDTVSVLADDCLLVWFSRGASAATVTTNYSLSSGTTTYAVKMAQYQLEVLNGVETVTNRGVRIYSESPLTPGQWTLGVSSNIMSDDTESVGLPSDTTIILDLTEITEDGQDDSVTNSDAARFVPKAFRNKPVIAAILEGYDTGDRDVAEQARDSFDQQFIYTSSGRYLENMARDHGVEKPNKLGISDQDFRTLTIKTINSKFTEAAFLNVLETFYGPDSCRGKVETSGVGPYRVMDGGTLDFVFDGRTSVKFKADKRNFDVSVRASAIELAAALNRCFDKNGAPGYAIVSDTGTVVVYSKTTGLRSSVAIVGGTLQPEVQFGSPIFGSFSTVALSSLQWEISTPRVGVVRFAEISTLVNFTNPILRAGDYVVITGNEFPEELRGSHLLIDVNRSYTGALMTQWFEIESTYVPS